MKYEHLFMRRYRQKIFEIYASKNYKKRKKLNIKSVDNGIVLPAAYDESDEFRLRALGGVLDDKGVFVGESRSYQFGGGYYYNSKKIKYIDDEVIFMGPFMKHWGHFLVDQISRLWYAMEKPNRYKIAYCGWNYQNDPGDIENNFLELINLLGIKKNQLINIQEPTQFRKVIIPEFSFVAKRYYSNEFEKMLDKIVNNAAINLKNCPEKIYFTRTELPDNSRDFGEKKVVEYLKGQGYVILAPERLSFSEQVYYLNNAKIICTTAGTTSHNIMFMRGHNKAIILNKFRPLNGYQVVIDHISKARITYVDAFALGLPAGFGLGPFLLSVNRHLRKCIGGGGNGRKYHLSFEDCKLYIKRYYDIYKEPHNRRRMKNDKTGI